MVVEKRREKKTRPFPHSRIMVCGCVWHASGTYPWVIDASPPSRISESEDLEIIIETSEAELLPSFGWNDDEEDTRDGEEGDDDDDDDIIIIKLNLKILTSPYPIPTSSSSCCSMPRSMFLLLASALSSTCCSHA